MEFPKFNNDKEREIWQGVFDSQYDADCSTDECIRRANEQLKYYRIGLDKIHELKQRKS